jgi:pSer/pThr/pTyr-binding forkhead associated (FHA) protein
MANPTAKRALLPLPFAAPHVFVVAAVDGDDTAAVHRLLGTDTIFGRGAEANVVVEDDLVSQRHLRLRVDGGVCTIVDLGSLNGTSLNGRPLRANVSQRLRHLDEFIVGNQRFLFLSGKFRDSTPERS